MDHDISMRRHFVVFDDRRYGGEKHSLIYLLEIIPTRKVKVLAGVLHVVLD
jgi:hypothetical protein